jgi:hypothetical protein
LPASVRQRVVERILALKENPRPFGCIKLTGYENEYRIRVGDYTESRSRGDAWPQVVAQYDKTSRA